MRVRFSFRRLIILLLVHACWLALLLLTSCTIQPEQDSTPTPEAATPTVDVVSSVASSAGAVVTETVTVEPTVEPTLEPTVVVSAETITRAAATPSTTLALSPEIEARIDALMAQMTLREKVGQMALVEKNSITPDDVTQYAIGGILSGGAGGYPTPNNAQNWVNMTSGFQNAALTSRLGIPILYGSDAIHGHNNLYGATIFPHNVGLGAARDADLVEEIGRLTSLETKATGVNWNFAPVVAVPQDIRWGRSYEAYSENTALVATLGTAYLRGLQGADLAQATSTLATPKHFIADGGTLFGSSTSYDFLLDQGDVRIDEKTLRTRHLPPYEQAIEAGARSIMVSFSSWNGIKMHARTDLLTWLLKEELEFTGFLVSDWAALDQISSDSYEGIVVGINAGIDMVMVPYEYVLFIELLEQAVLAGDVSQSRIDDAVRRILRVKLELGLFENPLPAPEMLDAIGSAEARSLARHAVRQSLVLLKNDSQTLPLDQEPQTIFVAGEAADDIGIQSGGWTIEWQGNGGRVTEGTTILDGIKQRVSSDTEIYYDAVGVFQRFTDASGEPLSADIGIVVVGERPYAEGAGDSKDLALTRTEATLIRRMQRTSEKVIVILVTGRPLIITDLLAEADAWVVAWLPGSEGAGVADILFGDNLFSGKLPYSWPRSAEQLPFNFAALPTDGCDAPLFPFGYGLSTLETSAPSMPTCAGIQSQN